ncbi:MAG: exonuclease domain-containing protein [Capnocytophaga sp.]|nr:exonuclease domain-containing protein [Capnocytophaga sp.]
MYAILDIETTGGKYNEEGITEIAIYRYDGHAIVDQFISLINPERPIQPFVVKLTGINNNMLRNAPKFFEVAKRIVEITDGCIIVAHNASFDYRILQTEFRRLGFDFRRTTLCTVELSQELIPGKDSYSLGKLVRSLGIPVSERHRASGDALATVKLFKYLLEKDTKKQIVSRSVKNDTQTQLTPRFIRIVDELPERLGVYYMHDENGKIIYIGRHKNIKRRVNQHFTSTGKRDSKLIKHVHAVTYEESGTELIAKLKKQEEILQNKPKYNFKKNKEKINYALTYSSNNEEYVRFSIVPYGSQYPYITTFENLHQAQNFLYQITEEFSLCPKFQGLSEAKAGCYNSTVGKCYGACTGNELPETYNQRAKQVIEKYDIDIQTIALIDKGRTIDEKSAILIEQGHVKGYGFFTLNHQINHLDILQNLMTPLKNSSANKYLIQQYMRTHKTVRIQKIETQSV